MSLLTSPCLRWHPAGVLIRYVDGPYKGDTVMTDALEIEGTFLEGDIMWRVRYRVDRATYTASEVGRAPIGTLPEKQWPAAAPADAPTTTGDLLGRLCDATTEAILSELARRAEAGDMLADAYLHPRITSVPMRRRREPLPRAGFGQVPRVGG